MASLTSQPLTTRFNPIGSMDCIRYIVSAPEAVASLGAQPGFSIIVSTANQVAGNTMVMFGKTFTVHASITDDDQIALTTGTALQKAQRIQLAINSNHDIFPFVSTNIFDVAGVVTLICFYTDKVLFVGDVYSNGTLATPYAINSEVQGSPMVMTSGFRLHYQLYSGTEFLLRPATVERMSQMQVKNSNLEQLQLDFANVAASLVRTTEPFLLLNSPQLDNQILKKVKLRYGSHATPVGVIPVYSAFKESNESYIMNSALNLGESSLTYNYSSLSTQAQRFLTRRPLVQTICGSAHQWLHFVANAGLSSLFALGHTIQNYYLEVKAYDAEGALPVYTNTVVIPATEGVYSIPVGTAQLAGTLSQFLKYTVQVGVAHTPPAGAPTNSLLSVMMTFYPSRSCCETIYKEWQFLEPPGGYGPLYPYESESDIEGDFGTFAKKTKTCDNSTEHTTSGVGQHSMRAFERITMRFRERNTEQTTNYIKSARASIRGYLKILVNGAVTWKKFIPDAGDFPTKVVDGFIEFEVSGILAQEQGVLKDVNQIIGEI